MERLLVLKLQALGCEAEAWLNGVPIVRVNAARPRAVLPVHEFAMAGNNQLQLIVSPRPALAPIEPVLPPEPRVSDGKVRADLRVLLPRFAGAADETSARTLGQHEWAPAEGAPYQVPLTHVFEVPPVSFPRWRWLDAPAVELTPALRWQALAFVQRIALDLSRGETDSFIAATRLRTEELALAYQRNVQDEIARVRAHLLQLHAAKRLSWLPVTAEAFALRRIASGRLFECLDSSGEPALRTVVDADGVSWVFPLRLAVVEGMLYVLR